MKRTNTKTVTYKHNNEWFVDIVITKSKYLAYLYNESCYIKELLFSVPREQQSFCVFLSAVEANLDDDIINYKETYMTT